MYGQHGRTYCISCLRSAQVKHEQEAKKPGSNLGDFEDVFDCGDCENIRPVLDEDSKALLECFIGCDSQVRAASMGNSFLASLDWGVIIIAAQARSLQIDEFFFRALRRFETVFIKELTMKRK